MSSGACQRSLLFAGPVLACTFGPRNEPHRSVKESEGLHVANEAELCGMTDRRHGCTHERALRLGLLLLYPELDLQSRH